MWSLKLVISYVSGSESIDALGYQLFVLLDLVLGDLLALEWLWVNTLVIIYIFGHSIAQVSFIVGVLKTLSLLHGLTMVGLLGCCLKVSIRSLKFDASHFVSLYNLALSIESLLTTLRSELFTIGSRKSILWSLFAKWNIGLSVLLCWGNLSFVLVRYLMAGIVLLIGGLFKLDKLFISCSQFHLLKTTLININ